MEINKKTRTELKAYFKANDKPTEKQFADFIDAGINQAEDSIVKEQGNPLAIQAEGDEVGTQEVLDLYTSFAKNSPNWSLNLNPRVKSEDPNSNQSGLNIKDTTGQSRLFIKSGDGNIGLGTIEPESKLTIQGKNDTSSLAVIDTTRQNAKIFEISQKDGDGVLSLRGGNTEEGIHLSGSRENASFFLGKVGIGTNSPGALLEVKSEGAALKITNTKPESSAQLGLYNNEKSWGIEANGISGDLLFHTIGNKDKAFVMKGNGSVIVKDGLNVAGHLEINKKLRVGQELFANNRVFIKKQLDIEGQLTAKENSVFEKNLTIHGDIKTPITQVVAFSVSLSADMGGAKNPLTFGQMHYNYGEHFKKNQHFIAPVKGLYVFTMCLRSTTDGGTIWNLRLNDSEYVNGSGTVENTECSMISTTKKFHSSSRSIITLLEVGDKVHVHQTKGGADNYSSGFEGMLLQVLV